MIELFPPFSRIHRTVLVAAIVCLLTSFASVVFVAARNDSHEISGPPPQNFVVTNNNDQGAGSLREALLNANATVGSDTITFDIPGPGVKVISLLSVLPEITDPVVIDASTQPGYAGTPLIELDGTAIGSSDGLVIRAGGTTIRGLAFGRFTGNAAIWIRDCDNNVIQGNHIGVDAAGTVARSNSRGILLSNSSNNVIGGTTSAARNVISGNTLDGVELGGNNNVVQGNYIGTDVTGNLALGNTFAGISIQGANHLVGGLAPGAGNVISGNLVGIKVGVAFSNGVAGNTIQGNLIGLNALGTGPLRNGIGGIEVSSANNTTIGGTQNGAANTVAFNGGPGVLIVSGTGNKIRGNSIFSNAALGIDLGTTIFPQANGVTANDASDADNGANNLQNFPLLTSVTSVGSNTTIQGTLNSTPDTTFQIDFYTSAALDPSGNGEGAQFFNSTSVTTDANGNATINTSFPVALGTGRVVTATATDPSGNTSEFSAGDATGATGNVQFSVSLMNVIEDIGLMTVTVLRAGGSAGTLTVDFATADGTAIAGQDYTATSGTLTFSGGETSKTFQIPITNDAATETNETFTVSLRNTSNLEFLGVPSTLSVNVLDRSIVPTFLISNATVVEGGPGTTTQLLVPLNLFAATGRTVSVNFATSNSLAVGGTSCDTRGVDYITTSGTVTFQPGTSAMSIPITICGDSNAEANEAFLVHLSNPVNGQFFTSTAFGQITNDDVLELVLEESGPVANQAAALDSLLLVRDPFRIAGIPDWWPGSDGDRNTRVILFARGLELNPGELPSEVIVTVTGFSGQFVNVPAEAVQPIHNFELTQVVFRLPDQGPGIRTVTITAHGRVSNSGTLRIVE